MNFVIVKDKQKYFNENYPFAFAPKLTDWRFCIHCDEWFQVKDFKVVQSGRNELIVCPNAPQCDGSVIDWIECNYDGKTHKDLFPGNRIGNHVTGVSEQTAG